MRHLDKVRKFNKDQEHRKAMFSNMMTSFFTHERITTTLAKAKELRRLSEKAITRAKENSLHNKRMIMRRIHDRDVIAKLFDEIAPKYKEVNGGYTRIFKLGNRAGDGANLARIELVDPAASAEKKKSKSGARKASSRRPAAKEASAKTAAAPAAKPAAKPEAKTSGKAEAKTSAKPEVKPPAKPEAKTSAKPEAKTSAKPEAKASAKPEAKASAKQAAKPPAKGRASKKKEARKEEEKPAAAETITVAAEGEVRAEESPPSDAGPSAGVAESRPDDQKADTEAAKKVDQEGGAPPTAET